MHDTTIIFFVLDMFALIFLCCWLANVYSVVMEFVLFGEVFAYLVSIGSIVFHFSAFLIYLIKLDMNMKESGCQEDWDANINTYCWETGPKLSLAFLCMLFIDCLVFFIVTMKRPKPQENETSE